MTLGGFPMEKLALSWDHTGGTRGGSVLKNNLNFFGERQN